MMRFTNRMRAAIGAGLDVSMDKHGLDCYGRWGTMVNDKSTFL